MGDSISEGVIEEFVKGKLAFFLKRLFLFLIIIQLPETSLRLMRSLPELRPIR